MGPGEAFALITLFLSLSTVFILRGPLGKAWADRIAGRSGRDAAGRDDIDRLQGEVDELKHRLAETEDRLDFAERLLAKQREHSALEPGN